MQDPPAPELEERQAAIMRARGFRWEAKRRAWVRGQPRERLECRSGGRLLCARARDQEQRGGRRDGRWRNVRGNEHGPGLLV